MISIQDHPRFKNDNRRYLEAIRNTDNEQLKKELKSLHDRFLSTIKQIDNGMEMLMSEGTMQNTYQTELQGSLAKIRAELEEKIKNL
jgi:hypothetical protein